MGKLNEIQDEKTQSWGSNSFTTTVKENTVEFDSAKDKFTFLDEVEVPSLKVNGDSVSAQVQSDWNQNDDTKADYIKNKPTIPSAQVQADWNQNDDTKSDYIKNRICYKEGEVEDVYANVHITENINYNNCFNFSKTIEEGKTYKVMVNGTLYTSTAVLGKDYGTYPNTICLPINNIPYLIVCDYMQTYFGGYTGGILGSIPPYPIDLKIYTGGYEYHTIDDKFIPDTIVRTSQLGGVQFKIEGSPAALMASIDGGTTWQTVTLS